LNLLDEKIHGWVVLKRVDLVFLALFTFFCGRFLLS